MTATKTAATKTTTARTTKPRPAKKAAAKKTAAAPALSVPTLALTEIRTHPANPRLNAVADEAMVDSIRAQGINEPLMVAPAPDGVGWFLVDGHRRLSGATQAGLTEVPVNPRYDLTTEAQQVQVMVVTGLQKELLTPVEEAAAYQQLTLHGLDEAAICAATGFGKVRVRSRLRLNTLPEEARGHLQGGDMTLADAEMLLEFEDDPDATAELLEAIGTTNFRWKVQQQREARERAAKNATTIADYVEAGAVATDQTDEVRQLTRFRTEDLQAGAGHPECLGYIAPEQSWARPYLVCLDPTVHADQEPAPAADDHAARQAEREERFRREQAERDERLAADRAASAARIEWLVEHLTGCLPARGNTNLTAAARVLVPLLVPNEDEKVDDITLRAAFGFTTTVPVNPAEHATTADQARAYADTLRTATATTVLAGFARYLAAIIADQLATDSGWLETPEEVRHHLELWDWATAAGYPMSDLDKATRARLESKLLEVTEDGDG